MSRGDERRKRGEVKREYEKGKRRTCRSEIMINIGILVLEGHY